MHLKIKIIEQNFRNLFCYVAKVTPFTLFLFLQHSQLKVYQQIWNKKINVGLENLYFDDEENFLKMLKRIQKEKLVIIENHRSLINVLMEQQICDVTLSKKFYKLSFAFAAQKGFPYMDMFRSG